MFFLEMSDKDPLPLPQWWLDVRGYAGDDAQCWDVVLQCYRKEDLPLELEDTLDEIVGHAERMDVAPPLVGG